MCTNLINNPASMPEPDLPPKPLLSHSRRHLGGSAWNIDLSYLSLSPFTSVSNTAHDFMGEDEKSRPVSYIQVRSASTTPGILSRNHSFTSQRSFYNDLPKSKSSCQLAISNSHSASSQWLRRTGAALTSETRECKGQSWLTSHASSTCLLREGEDDESSVYYGADDEFSPVTPRRRLSRNFSGEFHTDGLQILGGSTLIRIEYERGEEDEDENVEEYTDIPRGFGFGQFVDKLVGWSVFADNGTDSDESLDGDEKERRPAKARKGQVSTEVSGNQGTREQQRRLRDESEEWQDPEWILTIVSQIFL